MWVGPEIPELVKKCVATHNLDGYSHFWVDDIKLKEMMESIGDLRNCIYLNECLEAKRWGKASDYLRIYLLEKIGGIYLDADTEILKTFDDVIDNKIFVCEEENMFIANGIIGAEAHHPMLQHYKKLIEDNFRGTGDLVFQPGMYLWTELVKYSEWSKDVKIYPAEWFLPYNHQTNVTKVTENTHTNHFYLKSWLKKNNA